MQKVAYIYGYNVIVQCDVYIIHMHNFQLYMYKYLTDNIQSIRLNIKRFRLHYQLNLGLTEYVHVYMVMQLLIECCQSKCILHV